MRKFYFIAITNDIKSALACDSSGVDFVMVDLERNGKLDRQNPSKCWITDHEVSDIAKISSVLRKSNLMVRINPIFSGTEYEVNEVISMGAKYIMLPMVKTLDDVILLDKFVNSRAKIVVLIETLESFFLAKDIFDLGVVDFFHFGLNDLSIQANYKFMFSVFSNPIFVSGLRFLSSINIPFGVGGVGRMSKGGVLDPKAILTQHRLVGSQGVILSRSFFSDINLFDQRMFEREIDDMRDFYDRSEKAIDFGSLVKEIETKSCFE